MSAELIEALQSFYLIAFPDDMLNEISKILNLKVETLPPPKDIPENLQEIAHTLGEDSTLSGYLNSIIDILGQPHPNLGALLYEICKILYEIFKDERTKAEIKRLIDVYDQPMNFFEDREREPLQIVLRRFQKYHWFREILTILQFPELQ